HLSSAAVLVRGRGGAAAGRGAAREPRGAVRAADARDATGRALGTGRAAGRPDARLAGVGRGACLMCGIAGYAGPASTVAGADPLARPGRVTATIARRGPDEDGLFAAYGVGLGMRRLSIIDLGGGRQPITNEDGTVTVVFNGEIYNYRELRDGLIRRGHV